MVPRPESELLVEAALDLPEGARVHDVGTGSGAIALALLDERPDLQVSASEVSPEAVEVARENAERLGLPLEVEVVDGVPPGDYDLVIANLPYVRDDRWEGLMPEINRYEPRVAITSGTEGLDAIRELIADDARRAPASRSSTHHDQAEEIRELLDEAVSYPDLLELGPHHRRPRAVTREEVETFERCISVGGVALFPADTVYGLATEPESREGVDRLYRLKGRAADTPAAVMFFGLELALAALPELGARTREAVGACFRERSRCCCRIRRGASRSHAGLSPSGSACACRCSRASSHRWPRCAGPCSSRARIAPASRTRRAWPTWTRSCARAWTSSSTAASCPVRPRPWWTSRTTKPDGSWEVVREGAIPQEAVLRCLR